jgi:hypothetical protein
MMTRILADLSKAMLNALAVGLAVAVLMVSGAFFLLTRKRP